jgi:hypothetical protein
LSQDDSNALRHAIQVAAGEQIYVPPGQYRLDRPVTTTLPVNLVGAGHGCGPGPAAISNSNCSQFYIAFSGGTAIRVENLGPSTFRGLQFNVAPANRGRPPTAIALVGPASPAPRTTANSIIDACGFSNPDIAIRLIRPIMPRIRDCYFDSWRTAGVHAVTTPGVESSSGCVENNYFFGESNAATKQGPCVYTECGYGTVARNLLLGATVGVRLHAKNNPVGSPKIYQNWIENQSRFGVWVTGEPPPAPAGALDWCTMLEIAENEFSNVEFASNLEAHVGITGHGLPREDTDWISTIAIRNNIFRSQLAKNSKFIWLATGRNVRISGNLIHCLGGGAPHGIQCTGWSVNTQLKEPITICDNQFLGTFRARLSLAPPPAVFVVRGNVPPA